MHVQQGLERKGTGLAFVGYLEPLLLLYLTLVLVLWFDLIGYGEIHHDVLYNIDTNKQQR
jgi:hypothetical protein